jgi:hypothetical protein
MSPRNLFSVILKCSFILLILSAFYAYVSIKKTEKELIEDVEENNSEFKNLAKVEKKLEFQIAQKVLENIITQMNGTKMIQEKDESFELDDGITPEAHKIIKELGLISPGENGAAVELPANLSEKYKKRIEEEKDFHGFNYFVSNLVSLNRKIADERSDYCKNKKYSENLPKCSIVILFHNEDKMLLYRTVQSVINNSPMHLIEETLLLDDASDQEHLLKPLEDYVKKTPKLRLVLSNRRLGGSGSRSLGSINAVGPIIVQLDR